MALGFFTPLGTIAQEIFGGLFEPSTTDSKTLPSRAEIAPTPSSNAIVWQPQEITEVQSQAPYNVPVPNVIPAGYEFDSADYDASTQMTSLYYTLSGANPLYRNLVIKVYPEGSFGADEVGASATIETVSVNGIEGQFVQGAWETVATDDDGQAVIAWNSGLGLHRVKWVQDNLVYEVLFQAAYLPHPAYFEGGAPEQAGYLTQSDLIAIAESIQ
jgi:hypothetical protein